MKTTQPAAVLFDLDGTLLDTAPDQGAVLALFDHRRLVIQNLAMEQKLQLLVEDGQVEP